MPRFSCCTCMLVLITMTREIQSLAAGPSSLKAEWIQLTPPSKIEPRRAGHVSFTVNNRLFIFGGYAEVDDSESDETLNRFVVNDLWEWKGGDGGWIEQEQNAYMIPGPRLASAAVVLNGSPYLLGGWDPQTEGTGGIILDTVDKLDVPEGKWQRISSPFPDGPTSRHIALALPGSEQALVHNHRCIDHVLILDGDTDTIREQATSGTSPGSRGLHAAVMAGKLALIFGGAAKDGVMSNEVFMLNTETWEWRPVNLEDGDDCPSPRAGACLCRYSDECVILFGGAETTGTGLNPKGDVWALHFDAQKGTGQWQKLLEESEGDSPPPRNAATLSSIDPIDDKTGSSFLLTGGWAPFRRTWNDCFVLRVSDA